MFKNIISELTKKWKIRLIFWIFAGVIIIFLLKNYGLIWALIWLLFAVLGDELIKEGYVFKVRDLGKLTHETIAAVIAFIISIICVIRKRGLKR